MPETFESALQARADAMVDACTRCGKCVEACPVTGAAGLAPTARDNPVARHRRRHRHFARTVKATRRRANGRAGCVRSGDCIEACDYGVNPRFLLDMARVAMAHAKNDARGAAPQRRRRLSQGGARRQADFAHSARRRAARAAGAGRQASAAARPPTPARFRVLHRLQRAQDAAHRAAGARHHGCARRQL